MPMTRTTTETSPGSTAVQAKEQVKAFLALFDRMEGFSKEETYAAKEFHLDLRVQFKK